MKNLQQMIFFREILEVADCYPEDKRYKFIRGVIDYGLNGEDYLSKDDYFASSFVLCKSIIDRQQRRYAEKIQRYKQKKETTNKEIKETKETKEMKKIPFSDKEEEIIKQVLNYWNVQGLPKVERLTVQRKENVRRLIVAGEENYMLLNTIKKVKSSKFLCGDNARGWKANFDWLFSKTENYYKVKKDFYKNKEIKDNKNNKNINKIWEE